jgi:hypothetical protein
MNGHGGQSGLEFARSHALIEQTVDDIDGREQLSERR